MRRYLLPAMVVGFAISIITGNGWLGWLAGGVVVAVIAAMSARGRSMGAE